ncbi:MAG TPA: O-antigen ligase family protein [Candidatus Limnocylindrales bacterium]|nr:O-antigen ligase family protein [Candidatus Limnocylindrales bacterium]
MTAAESVEPDGISRALVGRVVLAALIALGTSLVSEIAPTAIAIPASFAIGGLLAWSRRLRPAELISAFIGASIVSESGLVPNAGRNDAPFVVAVPLLYEAYLRGWLDPRRLSRAQVVIGVAALAYVAFNAAAALHLVLRLHPYSAYLTGTIVLGLLLGIIVLPRLAGDAGARRLIVLTFAAAGPGLVLIELLLALTGPLKWFNGYIGSWVWVELTALGHPTGIVFAENTGPFHQPAGASTVLAISGIALVAIWSSLSRRGRLWAASALTVVSWALLVTLNRDGWLIAASGGLLVAGWTVVRRRPELASLAFGTLFLVVLGGVALNVIGANTRPDVTTRQNGPTVAATIPGSDDQAPVQVRGGSSLTGREDLWSASIEAIRQRPLLGWGPGEDQRVIGPLLPADAKRLVGYTSDSVYLRTAVETGLLGLAGLLLFCGAVLVLVAARLRRDRTTGVDATTLFAAAAFPALLVGGIFETYLLGGLTFPSFLLALLPGLALVAARLPGASGASAIT